MRHTAHIANLSPSNADLVKVLQSRLNGQTHMDLDVITTPCGEGFALSVSGEGESEQDVLRMALLRLAIWLLP